MIPAPKRREPLSWVPIAVGLYWLLAGSGTGWIIWAVVPGSLMLATGVALLLMPGEPRVTQYMALGGLLGMLFSIGALVTANAGSALLGALGAMGAFIVAGRVGLMLEPRDDAVPALEWSPLLDAKAALDESLLAYFLGSMHLPAGDEVERMCESAFGLQQAFQARGWMQDPALFHLAPPAPENIDSSTQRIYGCDYTQLSWESGFAPDDLLPGAATWRSYRENSQACVRVLRHPGKPRPWLLCIHGYRMGAAWMDFGLFSPKWLHQRLGLNIVQPVLPLHGPRKIGPRSGDHYLDGDLLDLVYAQSHALWDLRRTLAWIRQQEAHPKIGVYGVSLGGYNASLLAAYEADLEFVIAGIPVVDFAAAVWRFMPPAYLRYFAAQGMDEVRYREILKIISPLSRPPLPSRERLLILAGVADRIVPPRQPLVLARHWDVPVNWYQGGHLGLRQTPQTAEILHEAMLRAGWPALV
ncbi:MAG: alpha/beta hydrolase family protein [Stenotrophobium sp.]